MEQFYFVGKYTQALTSANDIFSLSRHQLFQGEDENRALALENVYITRARSLMQLERAEQAIASLSNVTIEHPDYLVAQLELLDIYLHAEQYREGEKLAARLIKANPNNDELVLRIGLLAAKSPLTTTQALTKKYFLVKAEKEQAINQRELALYRLSKLAAAANKVDEQLHYLTKIRATDDLVLLSIRQQADLLTQHQGIEKAKDFYTNQEARYPSLTSRIQLARAYWLSNINQQEALDYVSNLLTQGGNQQELLYTRGFFYAMEGDIEAMERDFSNILATNPLHVDTLNAYGYTLVDKTSRTDEGLGMISRAFAINSDRPAIVDSLAWAYFRLGQHRRALVLIQWAYARSQDPEIAAHYGEILWTLAYTDEARALLSRDRITHPDNTVIQDTWQRLFGN